MAIGRTPPRSALAGGLIRGQIEHRDHVVGDGAGDSVFAIWGYVDVVESPPTGMPSTSLRVAASITSSRLPAPDGHQHAPTVLCYHDIVRTPAERHLVSDLAAGPIHDIQYVFEFIADVIQLPSGETNAMRRCNTADNLHNLVRRGVYHLDAIAAAVGDVDPYLAGGGGEWRQRQEHPRDSRRL